jgi:hypothetical protein
VCSLRVTFLKTFPPATRNNHTTTTASDLHGLPQLTDPGRRALLTRAILHDSQNAIGAPAPISQRETAAVHGVAFGLALDAVDVRQAASDAAFSTKEVDVGLAVDMGTLASVPALVGNVSLLHESSLRSRRTRGARAPWCCVACCARLRSCARALEHSCVLFFSPSAFWKMSC